MINDFAEKTFLPGLFILLVIGVIFGVMELWDWYKKGK